MATTGGNNPTLIDVTKRLAPDGAIDAIAEILSETNEILDDMTMLEGNLPTGHRTTVRSGLPAATWRKLNYGVQPTKSKTVQITDSAGMLENYAEIDKSLADLNGNTAQFRASEDRAFLEGMNQDMANTLFYGDTDVNPERFMGLTPRFSTKSGAENGDNILLADASPSGSDQTSIWMIVWSPNTVHGFYPKGQMGGLHMQDKGQDTLTDAAGGLYEGYRTHYKWDIGLSLRDWRYVVRIANVDTSALTKDASAGADLIDVIVQALEILPNMSMGRPAIYCNRTVKSFLRRQISNKNNVNLTLDTAGGKHVLQFDGVPVRRCDAILNTEAIVS